MKRISLVLALSFFVSVFCVNEASASQTKNGTEMSQSKKTKKILKKRKRAYQKEVAARRCTRSTKELK